MSNNELVIVAAKRTPCGNLLGDLSSLSAPELGAHAIEAALKQGNINTDLVDEVILGCVLQAGIGQAPARQASRFAKLPDNIPATTVNKMCGSGMKSLMILGDAIKASSIQLGVCGGMESMSQAPYLLKKARQGMRLGHDKIYDHMFLDGLEDAYEPGKLMGVFAEETSQHFQFSRAQQDEFALNSLQKALSAQERGAFNEQITPITIHTKKSEITVTQDEGPDINKINKIAKLKPAFNKEGTITAANSSSISDGAAALIVTTKDYAKQHHLEPLAQIDGYTSYAGEPKWFTTAPVFAIEKLLKAVNWTKDDISLYEINEAFACVAMVAIQELNLDPNKVNCNGGACALGHPIGASGARILTTLLYALKPGEKGIASLCIGGGEATAVAITRY